MTERIWNTHCFNARDHADTRNPVDCEWCRQWPKRTIEARGEWTHSGALATGSSGEWKSPRNMGADFYKYLRKHHTLTNGEYR